MKNKKAFLLILPVVTVILEALPCGAVLNFANPDGEPLRKNFSLTPFGYANFAPFITAVITCVAFVVLLFFCVAEKQFALKLANDLLVVGVVLSLRPLGFGFSSFSAVAGLISISLLAEFVLVRIILKKQSEINSINNL